MALRIWMWIVRAIALVNLAEPAAWWVWQHYVNPTHEYHPLPWLMRTLDPITSVGFVYLPGLLLIEIVIFCVGRSRARQFAISAILLAAGSVVSLWGIAVGLSHLR